MNDNDHDNSGPKPPVTRSADTCDHHDCDHPGHGQEAMEPSRRRFLKTSATSLAAGAVVGSGLTGNVLAGMGHDKGHDRGRGKGHDKHHGPPPRHGKGRGERILLKGGVVLSLDPAVGDFEQADVLIEDSKIVEIRPNIHASAKVVDCKGKIVMPGFISTHHHQYEAVQRSIIADGYIVFGGDEDQQSTELTEGIYEDYRSVVQGIWTSGRLGPSDNPVWDIQQPPQAPEDVYIAQLISCLSEMKQGITCGTDTSQASHTPDHTDAMIEGIMDSGRRTFYDYSGGTNRSDLGQPYEHPYPGVERIANKYFTSKDQLVTLGLNAGPTPIDGLPAPFTGMTGWELAREFGAFINNHNVGGSGVPQLALDNGLAPFDDVTLVHCVRWQDEPYAQISHSHLGFPNPATSDAWQIWADNGGHVSIATVTEMQMRHGMPPIQQALNHGILPSLSPDVDTNNTPDPFSLMRGTFCLQRALANDLTFPLSDPGPLPTPQTVTSRQVVEMMTIAGAAGSGLLNKVGTLTPGKEADIVILEFDNIHYQPMHNVYGTVVTMMDTSAVQHVMIAGKFTVWNGELVGWNEKKVIKEILKSYERVLARINGPAVGTDTDIINRGFNSEGNPYRPAFLTSCCFNRQNEFAPHYELRP